MAEDRVFTRQRLVIPALLLFFFSFALFLLHARERAFPPDKDQLDYLIVAQNLAEGRGLVEDVIWNFLRRPPNLTHASFDYWMPLTSILIAPFTALEDPRWPIVPIALVSAVAVVLAFCVLEAMLGDVLLAFGAAALFAATQKVVYFASSTDSTMVYSAWVLAALLLFTRLSEPGARRAHALGLGTAVALAILTRADALAILPATLLLTALVARWRGWPTPPPSLLGWAVLAAAPWVLAWSVRSFVLFGTLWNPASGRVLGLSSYDEAMRLGRTASGPIARLLADPGAAWASKIAAAGVEFRNLLETTPVYLTPFIPVGLFVAARRRTPAGLAYPLLFLPLLLAYAGLVDALHTIGGAFRTSTVLIPCVYGLVALGASALVGAAAKRLAADRAAVWVRAVSMGVAGFGALALFASTAAAILPTPPEKNADLARAQFYANLKKVMAQHIPPGAPVMTNQPLELNYATGRPAVMAPLDRGLEGVCLVANQYKVRHLVLIDDELLQSHLAVDLTELLQGGIFPATFELLKDEKPVYRIWTMHCPPNKGMTPASSS